MESRENIFEISDVIVSYDDFKEYAKSMSTNRYIKIWKGIGVGYITLFGVVLLILSLLSENSSSSIQSQNLMSWDFISRLSGFFLMIFILFVFPWFVYPYIMNRTLKKTYENNKFIKKPQKYLFDENGLKVQSENGESRHPWDDISSAKETKDYLALYITKYHAFIIPRKYLDDKKYFVDFVKERLGKRYSVIKNYY